MPIVKLLSCFIGIYIFNIIPTPSIVTTRTISGYYTDIDFVWAISNRPSSTVDSQLYYRTRSSVYRSWT